MATRLLLHLWLSLSCAAFSWPRQLATPSTARSPPSRRLPFTSGGPSEIELAALIVNHEVLDSYSRRPDCFRRVAARIRSRCEELETREDERIRAAISMTLCELATATHHSLPLECKSFAVDAEMSNPQTHGECVDALSRSAQFWSSYSGYLREVPQLCFAFRRWNDIDTAREIYKNSTLETTRLIRWVLAREKLHEEASQRRDTQLVELEDVTERLGGMSNMMSDIVNAAAPRLQSELILVLDAFRTSLVDAQQIGHAQTTRITDLLSTELQLVSNQHALSLNDSYDCI
ncbi:hypothetical protein C8F01DRAFT_322306 [Mycena amicta]|nr:hypothetical protein C8F01DRAFT_322306 [Mycena amicta]